MPDRLLFGVKPVTDALVRPLAIQKSELLFFRFIRIEDFIFWICGHWQSIVLECWLVPIGVVTHCVVIGAGTPHGHNSFIGGSALSAERIFL